MAGESWLCFVILLTYQSPRSFSFSLYGLNLTHRLSRSFGAASLEPIPEALHGHPTSRLMNLLTQPNNTTQSP